MLYTTEADRWTIEEVDSEEVDCSVVINFTTPKNVLCKNKFKINGKIY